MAAAGLLLWAVPTLVTGVDQHTVLPPNVAVLWNDGPGSTPFVAPPKPPKRKRAAPYSTATKAQYVIAYMQAKGVKPVNLAIDELNAGNGRNVQHSAPARWVREFVSRHVNRFTNRCGRKKIEDTQPTVIEAIRTEINESKGKVSWRDVADNLLTKCGIGGYTRSGLPTGRPLAASTVSAIAKRSLKQRDVLDASRPFLTEQNIAERLEYAGGILTRAENQQQYEVHLDEKWFYMYTRRRKLKIFRNGPSWHTDTALTGAGELE